MEQAFDTMHHICAYYTFPNKGEDQVRHGIQ
jgi:hypothetical protein